MTKRKFNWRLVVVLAVVALALPFPSSVRYAPVARGFYAAAFEEAGDVPDGAVLLLAGSVLYLAVYTSLLYLVVVSVLRLWRRLRT